METIGRPSAVMPSTLSQSTTSPAHHRQSRPQGNLRPNLQLTSRSEEGVLRGLRQVLLGLGLVARDEVREGRLEHVGPRALRGGRAAPRLDGGKFDVGLETVPGRGDRVLPGPAGFGL